jgi:hypothetical protein
MEACDTGHSVSLLLVHLLEAHAAAQAAVSGEAAASTTAASSASPLAALEVPEGVLFSCLEAWKDR